MGIGKYILDAQQQPVEEPDLLTWGRWMETADRHVAVDQVGDAKVSTIFLGLDHRFGDGPPVLYETMVFGGPLDMKRERYATRDEAIAGHAAMLARVLTHMEQGAR